MRKAHGIMAFVEALGIDFDSDWCWTDVSRRVADLIDPTCSTREYGRPDEFRVVKGCSVCGNGWYEDTFAKPYQFCPHCGARVVNE